MKNSDKRLPVTVLSGFLGSGKTTLMNHLAGWMERRVFQGVHGMFRMTLGQMWEGDRRLTEAVFIGRNLRREDIAADLEACRA